jgi:hypothetical protein
MSATAALARSKHAVAPKRTAHAMRLTPVVVDPLD